MGDELHSEQGQEPVEAPPASPVDLAAERTRKRSENLRKAQLASAAAHKRKREQKAAREAKKAAAPSPAPATDDQDPLQAMLEQPIASHEELAQVLANLEQTAGALAFGTRAEPIVSALAWSTSAGKPSPRCQMGAKMLWPWLVKTGGLAQLAEQSAEILALLGVVVLVGPAVPPAFALVRAPTPTPTPAPPAKPVEPPPAQPVQPPAPNVHQMGAAA